MGENIFSFVAIWRATFFYATLFRRKDGDRLNSTNTTKRLFNRTLNHERIEITNYYTSEIYRVFFRRNDRSTTPQGKVRLFYPCTTNIKIGTIFSLYNKGKYLVVSQDSDENSVYYTSLAIRCDETFKVKHNNTLVSVPFVLSSEVYDISENSTISIIDGSIIAYTGLTEATKDITGTYNVFVGTYEVKNSFIRSGLIYYYLKRTAKETNTLTYTGATELDTSAGTYQLTYDAKTNGYAVNDPILTYVTSAPEIATVSDTGMLTLLQAGSVTITATWIEKDVECITEVTLTASPSEPDNPTTSVTITGGDTLRYGRTKTWTVAFTDSTGATIEKTDFKWNVVSNFTVTQTITDNKIQLKCTDDKAIDCTFTLQVLDSDGTTLAEQIITITG